MSIRARREQQKKISVKDKKLGRLLFCQDLSEEDRWFLNYINEERQHINFFYSMTGCALLGVGLNYGFFRANSFGYQVSFVAAFTFLGHLFVRRRLNIRFEERVNPYFEKYAVK